MEERAGCGRCDCRSGWCAVELRCNRLNPLEELRVGNAQTGDDALERVEPEVAVALLYVGQIAPVHARHEREPLLREALPRPQLLDAPADFVPDLRLSHARRVCFRLYCSV